MQKHEHQNVRKFFFFHLNVCFADHVEQTFYIIKPQSPGNVLGTLNLNDFFFLIVRKKSVDKVCVQQFNSLLFLNSSAKQPKPFKTMGISCSTFGKVTPFLDQLA